jgi:hypothetical protein
MDKVWMVDSEEPPGKAPVCHYARFIPSPTVKGGGFWRRWGGRDDVGLLRGLHRVGFGGCGHWNIYLW